MDKELNNLKKTLQSNFIEIGNNESMNTLNNNNDSLFLSITESGLKWQKKIFREYSAKTLYLFHCAYLRSEYKNVKRYCENIANKKQDIKKYIHKFHTLK